MNVTDVHSVATSLANGPPSISSWIGEALYLEMRSAYGMCMVAWGSKQEKALSSVPTPKELAGVQ